MSDGESVKKMLRSVLQSSKSGVSISRLQSEYRSLCGENIPLRKLGYPTLEDFLRSIPSVVRMEYRMGELTCFAAVCKETAHIAELVARQKSSKKPGRSQLVNCRMRPKPSNPYMLNVRPRSSLRQPSPHGSSGWSTYRARPHGGYGGFSASGDYRQLDQRFSSITPVEHRRPAVPQVYQQPATQLGRNENRLTNHQKPSAPSFAERPCVPASKPKPSKVQPILYDPEQIQSRLTQLLAKHCNGLWLSKLPVVYMEMFGQQLHRQALRDVERWTHICSVEKTPSTNRTDRLVYPPLPPKPSTVSTTGTTDTSPKSPTAPSAISTPRPSPGPQTPEKPSTVLTLASAPKSPICPKSPLAKPTFIFPPQPVSDFPGKLAFSITLRSPAPNPALAPRLPSCATRAPSFSSPPNAKPILPADSTASTTTTTPPPSSLLLPSPSILSPFSATPCLLSTSKSPFSPTSNPAPVSPSNPSAVAVSADVRQKLKELLSKYSHGLWAHALPKLFMDTYKTPFPEHVLGNLSLLLDICTVEYPMPDDKKKAILYNFSIEDLGTTESQESPCRSPPSGLKVLGSVVPPPLVLPSEQYPSVLVTNAKNSNAVTVRYVGENYSDAQEAMEDAMCSFYSQSPAHQPLSSPAIGQLAAVRGEEGDELARVQVLEVMASNKVKVYYVDYGFSVETSRTNLLELHQDFLSLPFQATNVRLAGLESYSSHASVLSCLDTLVVGKILLMETMEQCHQNDMPVAVLYDTSQDDDLNINATCLKALQDKDMDNPLTVNSTYQNVCVTNVCSDGIIYCQLPSRGTAKLNMLLDKIEAFFISQVTLESLVSGPFSGKFCLARHKGRWSRVEITSLYGSRVMDVLFIDLGVPATVEVTELREIPPPFLSDFTVIPPQAIKCRLADLTVPAGDWHPEAILWLKEAVLSSVDCRMKILKLDQDKEDRLVHMYLFIGADGQELDKSINRQLAQSELWQKLTEQNSTTAITNSNSVDAGDLSALVEKLSLSSPALSPTFKPATQAQQGAGEPPYIPAPAKTTTARKKPLPMPPLLDLPQPGQNMDVFVPVALHPGYFVVQPWQDLHKLVVLMGEMILYYNQAGSTAAATHVQKGEVYAAKIDKNWHRVQVKGVLTNGLVSAYELDHGKHELVRRTQLRPLIEEFRQLPFQAITAQLAGVAQRQWSEEASMVFRTHVEKRALVALVESIQEGSEVKGEAWERRLTVYLVDTAQEERDVWVHNMIVDVAGELSSAA
uniref:tudor domain-containing protein 7A-like n=1 Tax=Centroberyx gerrardi TaxID=166262 RepID=UPI003AAD656D